MLKHPPDNGVSGLMVGDDLPLCWVEDRSLLLGAGDHPLDGVLQVLRLNLGLFHTGSVQGSLIDWEKAKYCKLKQVETRSLLIGRRFTGNMNISEKQRLTDLDWPSPHH